MNRLRRAAALMLLAIAPFAAARPLAAQTTITMVVPTIPGTDTISPAPVISVTATPVPPQLQPSTVQLDVALDAQFTRIVFARATPALETQFHLDSLLPAQRVIFFRARLFDRFGDVLAEATFAHPVAAWLTLTTATQPTNVLFTRQPTFTWSSPGITLPPGPWGYTLTVFNTATNELVGRKITSSTSATLDAPLDACTSYRWSVGARAENSSGVDSIVVSSPGTFVIQTEDCPTATIFFNTFPNPFGRGQLANATCFWFDLAHRSTVHLTLYDARLRQVRRLVPGPQLSAVLDSGAYGRPAATQSGPCDPRLSWDGLDETGHVVPPGLYYAVFEADGKRITHKIVFTGR
jgi:hypothetical protein